MIQTPPLESSKPYPEGAQLRFFPSSDQLRFFTAGEIAEILKMHPQVITRKLQSGDIAGYKLGKDWRVSEAQLMDFLERHSNRRGSPAETGTPKKKARN